MTFSTFSNKGGVKVRKIILLMVIIIILSGCANGDRYNFSGSSENWDVRYVVDVSRETSQQESGTIKYVGEGSAPETINYEIKANAGVAAGTEVTLDDGVANTGYGACEGCAVIQKDEEIEVEIKWDGQIENLILTTDK